MPHGGHACYPTLFKMAITLRQIEAFVAVCQEGSFSKAAQRIHISQSGLSVLIRELESYLEARLFDRSTRQIVLTQAGHAFQGPAARLLNDLRNATGRVRGLAAHEYGQVTVAAPPLLASRLVVEVATRFRERYPAIVLQVLDLASEHVLATLSSGQADVAIGIFGGTENQAILPLFEGPPMVLVPPQLGLLPGRTSLSWAELAELPLVAPSRSNTFRQIIDQGFAQLGLQANIRHEVVQLSTVISMAEAGFGAAVLPPHPALRPRHTDCAVLALVAPVIPLTVVMAHDRFRTPSAAAKAFMQVAQATFQGG